MKLATSRLSVCPIRSKPDDESDMISQLLFGELVEILEKHKKNWVKVRCLNDDYMGWMDSQQLYPISNLSDTKASIALEVSQPIWCDSFSTYVTIGAELPAYDGLTAHIGDYNYRYSGLAIDPKEISLTTGLFEKLVKKWLNAPYLRGGRSPFGVDSSGFTQVVYKCLDLRLSRTTSKQSEQGETVDMINQAKMGDMAFFSDGSEHISHVGIMLSANKIIHASGSVRIDAVDHNGIFDEETEEYKYGLKMIKRNINLIQASGHDR